MQTEMDDDFLLRYARQILLPEIDLAGQEKLASARVLVIGLGGLGSPLAMYLASAGVGHLVLVDHDQVELSNLQRQIIHDQASLGRFKVESAAQHLARLNPRIRLTPLAGRLTGEELAKQVRLADAVVDCTDNFPTRFLLNETCVRLRKPLISGAAVRFEGQVTVFLPTPDSPCYRCLYHETEEQAASCGENGVFAPLVGVIGSLQAAETLKVLLAIGEPLCGRLLLFDAKTCEWRALKLRRDPHCPVCGDG
jgi:adenylyltransferase/sulfurtransferase